MPILLFFCVLAFSASLGAGIAALLATLAFVKFGTQDLVYRVAMTAPIGAVVGMLVIPWFYYKTKGVFDTRFMTLFGMSLVASCAMCLLLAWLDIGWVGMVASIFLFIAVFMLGLK